METCYAQTRKKEALLKKLLLSLLTLCSLHSYANVINYYSEAHAVVNLAIEEFDNTPPVCVLTVLHGHTYFSIYGGPIQYGLYGQINTNQTSRIVVKVDNKEQHGYGIKGGRAISAKIIDKTLLDEIEQGKELVYDIYPTNPYVNRETHTWKSNTLHKAVAGFKKCQTDLHTISNIQYSRKD